MATTKFNNKDIKVEYTINGSDVNISVDDRREKVVINVSYTNNTLKTVKEKRGSDTVTMTFYESGNVETISYNKKKHSFKPDETPIDDSEAELERISTVREFSALFVQQELSERYGNIINMVKSLHTD